MIPISDDNPTQRPAFITWMLIVFCILGYLWERSLGSEMNAAPNVLGFVPPIILRLLVPRLVFRLS